MTVAMLWVAEVGATSPSAGLPPPNFWLSAACQIVMIPDCISQIFDYWARASAYISILSMALKKLRSLQSSPMRSAQVCDMSPCCRQVTSLTDKLTWVRYNDFKRLHNEKLQEQAEILERLEGMREREAARVQPRK